MCELRRKNFTWIETKRKIPFPENENALSKQRFLSRVAEIYDPLALANNPWRDGKLLLYNEA